MQHHFAPWLRLSEAGAGTIIAPSFDLGRALGVEQVARRNGGQIPVALGEDIFHGQSRTLRDDVWQAIESTPNLVWLILTRYDADRIADLAPAKWVEGPRRGENHPGGWPSNLWLGSVFSDQAGADVAHGLLELRPRRRVLFCVSPTEPISLSRHFAAWRCERCGRRGDSSGPLPRPDACPTGPLCGGSKLRSEFDWLILSAPTLGDDDIGGTPPGGIAVSFAEQAESAGVPFMFSDPVLGICPDVMVRGEPRIFKQRPGEGER